jgi:hypothetical protein
MHFDMWVVVLVGMCSRYACGADTALLHRGQFSGNVGCWAFESTLHSALAFPDLTMRGPHTHTPPSCACSAGAFHPHASRVFRSQFGGFPGGHTQTQQRQQQRPPSREEQQRAQLMGLMQVGTAQPQ